eukprot:1301650-Pyramimonas_sp.AAC.1
MTPTMAMRGVAQVQTPLCLPTTSWSRGAQSKSQGRTRIMWERTHRCVKYVRPPAALVRRERTRSNPMSVRCMAGEDPNSPGEGIRPGDSESTPEGGAMAAADIIQEILTASQDNDLDLMLTHAPERYLLNSSLDFLAQVPRSVKTNMLLAAMYL